MSLCISVDERGSVSKTNHVKLLQTAIWSSRPLWSMKTHPGSLGSEASLSHHFPPENLELRDAGDRTFCRGSTWSNTEFCLFPNSSIGIWMQLSTACLFCILGDQNHMFGCSSFCFSTSSKCLVILCPASTGAIFNLWLRESLLERVQGFFLRWWKLRGSKAKQINNWGLPHKTRSSKRELHWNMNFVIDLVGECDQCSVSWPCSSGWPWASLKGFVASSLQILPGLASKPKFDITMTLTLREEQGRLWSCIKH